MPQNSPNAPGGPNDPHGPVDVPPDVLDKDFWKMVIKYQFIYSVIGLFFALVCLVCGMVLFLHGVAGDHQHWSADIFGIKINDAAPGIVLVLCGVAVAQFTRFDVCMKRLTSRKTGILSWFKDRNTNNTNNTGR